MSEDLPMSNQTIGAALKGCQSDHRNCKINDVLPPGYFGAAEAIEVETVTQDLPAVAAPVNEGGAKPSIANVQMYNHHKWFRRIKEGWRCEAVHDARFNYSKRSMG